LKLAAVTGTNGKTTTTFLIKHICEKAGMRCGLLGTVRYEIGERILPAARTTPESLDLQELLPKSRMPDAGVRRWKSLHTPWRKSGPAASSGTSQSSQSHARPSRLSRDDGNYFKAKAKLFEQLAEQQKKKKPVAVINSDDRYGRKLVAKIEKKVSVVTFGMGARADFRASNYRMEFAGTSYQLDARGKSYLVRVPLIGRFQCREFAGRARHR